MEKFRDGPTIFKQPREIEEICKYSDRCDQMSVYNNIQDKVKLQRNINIFNDSKYISYIAGLGIAATSLVTFFILAKNFLDFLEEYACNQEDFLNLTSNNCSTRVRH